MRDVHSVFRQGPMKRMRVRGWSMDTSVPHPKDLVTVGVHEGDDDPGVLLHFSEQEAVDFATRLLEEARGIRRRRKADR